MSSNRLRLNPSKTELIWLGTSRRLQHCDGFNVTVCGADVRPVECVRDLGVLIDSNMTLSNHVNNVAGICFYQLRQLRIIRRSLTTDAAHSLVRALIHTRVDYCNGLLAAGPKYLHEKLQSVLRAAARLVLQLPYRASVPDIMRQQLHWLEMPDRVRFKLCTLVYRCLHGLAPHYLFDLCTPATVHTHLRSSVTLERSLSIPRTKTKTIGPRGFYFASSAAWNALPVHLRDPELSLSSFKTKLKTHFFSWYPPTWLTLYHVIFVRRARQRDNLKVGACKCLYWIELIWWCGMVWYGVVWCGVMWLWVWRDLDDIVIWCDTVWCDDVVSCDGVMWWCYVMWMMWYDMVWGVSFWQVHLVLATIEQVFDLRDCQLEWYNTGTVWNIGTYLCNSNCYNCDYNYII